MIAFVALLSLPFLILWNGLFTALAGWQLYQWFLIPMSFPNINGWHIAGIGLFISFLRWKPDPKKDEKDGPTVDSRIGMALAQGFIAPPMIAFWSLLIGYVFAKAAGLI